MRILSFWPLIFAIFLIGAGFYFVLGRDAQVQVAEQLMNEQRTIANAEVSNVITFFERFGDGVATLAQLGSVESRDADVLDDLDIFMEQREDTGIFWGVILTDKEGVVEFNSNVLKTSEVGES